MENEIGDLSFEAAFAELEQMVAKLEDGGLTLEESLAVFERGRVLAAFCSRKLEEAELKVKQIAPEDEVPFEVQS